MVKRGKKKKNKRLKKTRSSIERNARDESDNEYVHVQRASEMNGMDAGIPPHQEKGIGAMYYDDSNAPPRVTQASESVTQIICSFLR